MHRSSQHIYAQIIDDAAGEDGAAWLQLQRFPVCQLVALEAVTPLGGRLFGEEVALGGAAAVEAEQAAFAEQQFTNAVALD